MGRKAVKREDLEAMVLKLANGLGLSTARPEDGWKLAVWLIGEGMKRADSKKRGVKADPHDTVDDLILMYSIKSGEAQGKRGRGKIIEDTARANGWRTDASSISTKRTRSYRLEKLETNERRAMAELGGELLPLALAHFSKKWIVRN